MTIFINKTERLLLYGKSVTQMIHTFSNRVKSFMKRRLAYHLRSDSLTVNECVYLTVFKYIGERRSFIVLKSKINASYESEIKLLGLYCCLYYSSP